MKFVRRGAEKVEAFQTIEQLVFHSMLSCRFLFAPLVDVA